MTARERRKQRKHRGRERTGSLKLFVTLSYVRLARARRSFLELHVSSSDAHLISFLDWKVTYLLIVISAVFVYQILECRRNIHFFLSSNLFSRYGCRCGDIHWLRDEECYEHVKSRDKGRDDNRELKVPLTPPIFFPCLLWRKSFWPCIFLSDFVPFQSKEVGRFLGHWTTIQENGSNLLCDVISGFIRPRNKHKQWEIAKSIHFFFFSRTPGDDR